MAVLDFSGQGEEVKEPDFSSGGVLVEEEKPAPKGIFERLADAAGNLFSGAQITEGMAAFSDVSQDTFKEGQSLVSVPRLTAGEVARTLGGDQTNPSQTARTLTGLQHTSANIAEGILSPVGIAGVAASVVDPPAAPAIAAGFGALMAKDVPALAQQAGEAFGSNAPIEQKVETLSNLASTIGMAALALQAGGKGLKEQAANFKYSPTPLTDIAHEETVNNFAEAETRPSRLLVAETPSSRKGRIAALAAEPGTQLKSSDLSGPKVGSYGGQLIELSPVAIEDAPNFAGPGDSPIEIGTLPSTNKRASRLSEQDYEIVNSPGLILPERFIENEAKRNTALDMLPRLQDRFAEAAKAGDIDSMLYFEKQLSNARSALVDVAHEKEAISAGYEGEYPPTAEQLATFQSRAVVPELSDVTRRAEPEKLPVANQPISTKFIRGTRIESWANRVIQQGKGRLHSGFDPELLTAYAVKGAALIEQGVRDFAKWSKQMIDRHGDEIKPYLDNLYRRSTNYYERQKSRVSNPTDATASKADTASTTAEASNQPGIELAPDDTGGNRVAAKGLDSAEFFSVVPQLAQGAGLLPALKKLSELRALAIDFWKRAETRDELASTYDAMRTQATIAGERAGKEVELQLGKDVSKADLAAITPIVEAGGDLIQLTQDRDLVVNSAKASAKDKQVYKDAVDNFARLQPIVGKVDAIHQAQLQAERAAGINVSEADNYIAHRYADLFNGSGAPAILDAKNSRALGSTFFKKERTYNTYAEAIADGYEPRTLNAADLVNHRVRAGQSLINQRAWVEGLKQVISPFDGVPVAADLVDTPNGKAAPKGYAPVDVFGQRIAVTEAFKPIVKALTGESDIPKVLSNTAGLAKHWLLLIDTFHAGRIFFKELALGNVGYDKGLSILQYADKDLAQAVREKTLTQEQADWAKANRPKADVLVKAGLNVGQVSDALYRTVVKDTPIVGTFNEWVFGKLTRGAMMQTAISEFDRIRASHPELSEAKAGRMVAKNINQFFGNLGSQGIFKSKSWQDAMRIVFLAPQWVESMASTELGAVSQALKVPYDAVRGKGIRTGTLIRGTGNIVAATFLANQLINLATRGKMTWQNEEEGHKMDAWIPDFNVSLKKGVRSGIGPGFFLNPLAMPMELTHAVMSYSEREGIVDAATHVGHNKFGTLSRGAEVALTGKDPKTKQTLEGTWKRALTAAETAFPSPMATSAITSSGSPDYVGQQGQRLLGMAGIKTEIAPTPLQRLYALSDKWKRAHNIPNKDLTPSIYRPLDVALRMDDMEQAATQYDELVKKYGELRVLNHYNRATNLKFIGENGKIGDEARFLQSLTPAQRQLREQAIKEQGALQAKFFQMVQARKKATP